MEMPDMKKKIFDVETEMTFGIHKGSTIEEVFEEDCQYLIWMYDTFENVAWSDDALVLITEAMDIVANDGGANGRGDMSWGDAYDGYEEDSFSIY